MAGVGRRSFLLFIAANLLFVSVVLVVVRNFKISRAANVLPVLSNNTLPVFANGEANYISTDLVPHNVYFDRRSWASHSNSTVVFVSVRKDYRNTIVGCEIDGNIIRKMKVLDIIEGEWIEKRFPVSHRDCFVLCFDTNINKTSEVSVLYRKNGMLIRKPVLSESVVMTPENFVEKDEVMVCATGFGVVPNLDQWLTYQKTVGINFIHLNVNPSFLQNLNVSSSLEKLVQSGYVKMTVWKDYLNSSQVYYYSQSLKYHDCTLRYQGMYKYMMVIDFDEYFISYGTKKVLFHAKKLIGRNVGSVILARIEYHCKLKNTALPSGGNMTKLYNTSVSEHLPNGKSLYLLKSLEFTGVHQSRMLPKYRMLSFTHALKRVRCYIAHLSTRNPGKLKLCE